MCLAFFDAVDTKGLFKSIEQMYVLDEETMFDELMIPISLI